MGIQPLVAHRALPGARPSRRLRLKHPAPGPAEPPQTADTRPAATAKLGGSTAVYAAPEALRESLSAPSDSRPSRAVPTAPSEPQKRDEVADTSARLSERFSLAVLMAAGRLWIEDLAGSALAREQVDLVAAMALALSHPEAPGERPSIAQFDWPMHGNHQLDLGPEEARVSLESFLRRQMQERDCSAIVCLGEGARTRVSGTDLGAPVVVLPGTRELLQEPVRKREAWAALRT